MASNLRLPPGSLILVTGANGYVASHLVDQLIKRGYRVRGTVRDPSKEQWMLSRFGPNLTLTAVPDLAAPNALDEAVKGVNGIAHVAANVQFMTDAKAYIPPIVQSNINVLEAAAKEPNVKSVVFTSSQAAVFMPNPGVPYTATVDSWNDAAISIAENPPENPDLGFAAMLYCAAKALSEKASWDWVKQNKPSFAFNVVVPNVNLGTVLSVENQGFRSSAGLLKSLWDGSSMAATFIPPEWVIDVEETALVHVAALTLEEVKNERLFAFGHQFDWKMVLELLKKLKPDREFTAKVPDLPPDMGTVPNGRAEELLKKLGRPGFATLEEMLKKAILSLEEGERVQYPLSEMDRLAATFGENSGGFGVS